MTDPRSACTFLFVPGDRPDRFAKAQSSGADVVIVDLEDAVAPAAKPAARAALVEALRAGEELAVRVSADGSSDLEADLASLAAAPAPLAVVVAKAESAVALARIGVLGAPIIALVESAAGLVRAGELARAPGVVRLAFGALDYTLDLDSAMDPVLIDHARVELVVQSRAAGIAAPLDTPTTDFTRLDIVKADARRARDLGMAGKLCIHPSQVAPIAAAFLPTPEEVERARRVLATAVNDGAMADSGSMIDRPVAGRARRIVERAESRGRNPVVDNGAER
ncbi:CoA ester lyase [Microbacterium profundi]|uniref:HpcH/HpaI aldolase/citrate lyase family protein n=1 Tax=Microbacterium profundi TaxID=450380 RepID=UPI001F3EA29F|nr:CoA ester lyase [Microbacterium profundi]MCE7482028.1 CoA ester lyase [Microbacterium profundi]